MATRKPASTALTRRQQQVLDYITTALVTEHQWPTTAQIAEDFGITNNAASCCLKLIERKGHITRNARGKLMLGHIFLGSYRFRTTNTIIMVTSAAEHRMAMGEA